MLLAVRLWGLEWGRSDPYQVLGWAVAIYRDLVAGLVLALAVLLALDLRVVSLGFGVVDLRVALVLVVDLRLGSAEGLGLVTAEGLVLSVFLVEGFFLDQKA